MGVKLTGAACRAARALLGWTVEDLRREAGVSPNTVTQLEKGDKEPGEGPAARLLAAFRSAGVEILNGDRPGARMKPKEGA